MMLMALGILVSHLENLNLVKVLSYPQGMQILELDQIVALEIKALVIMDGLEILI